MIINIYFFVLGGSSNPSFMPENFYARKYVWKQNEKSRSSYVHDTSIVLFNVKIYALKIIYYFVVYSFNPLSAETFSCYVQ